MRKVGFENFYHFFPTLWEYFGVWQKVAKNFFFEESNCGSIFSPSLVNVSFV